jgi:hypothetical protein
METGECKLGLRFDADTAEDGESVCVLDRVTQERRLADAGLTAHDERSASALARLGEESIEEIRFGTSADQHPADRIPAAVR